MTTRYATHHDEALPDFTTSEGLRSLLRQMHAGNGAWRHDPAAGLLMEHIIAKYRRFAISWHREPADAAYAAFLAMQSPKILSARDPWGYVTRAVERGIKSETMGDRLLISASRASKGGVFAEAPTRAGDRDWLYDLGDADPRDAEAAPRELGEEECRLRAVVGDIVELLIGLGWPDPETDLAVDYIFSRTADAGSLRNAKEILRKEKDMPARLGIPAENWPGLLRVLLGGKTRPGRPTRKGVLVRLLQFDTIDTLLADHELILEIADAAPSPGAQHG